MGRIAGRFARVEPRRRARALVLGLLSGLRRKNCWTIAELAGDATPDGMQHLLAAARWDADAVRDDVRAYVVEHLGSADAVLVVDLCRCRNYAEVRAAWGERAWRGGLLGSAGVVVLGIVTGFPGRPAAGLRGGSVLAG
jgi:hypothetical protein